MNNKRGEISLRLAIILLVGMLLLAMGLETVHIYAVGNYTRSKANEAVLAVAAYNVAEFYGGAREGSGMARHPNGGGYFSSSVFTDDVVRQLARSLNGSLNGNTIEKQNSYNLSNITTQYVNYEGGALNFKTTFKVTIYLRVAGMELPALTKDMEVKTSYDAKF